jgi:OOP family OmpA-OmpF porin
MKMRWKVATGVFLAGALVLASAATSLSAPRAGAIEVSPFLGVGGFDSDSDLETGPALGARLGYWLTDAISAEAAFDWVDTETDSTNAGATVISPHADLLYNFTHLDMGGFVPFVAAGAGAMRFNEAGSSADWDAMANVGVGARLFFNDSMALRSDLRIPVTYDETDTHFLVTVGVSFLFGGAAAEPATAQAASKPAPADSDKDGVNDDADKCRGTPAGVKVDKAGCPLDSDGDGVYDDADNCPKSPKGAIVDAKGCSVRKVSVTLNVQFDTGMDVVKPEYDAELQRFADFLKKHPEATCEIGGHTDNVGSAADNKTLSQARADAVRKALVERFGIDGKRLTAVGYGPDRPIADNATPEGRQKNRRIEADVSSQIAE